MLHHEGIAHAQLPQGRAQHGLAAVKILPMQTILADGEINLLAMLIAFTDKMRKQITGHNITSKALSFVIFHSACFFPANLSVSIEFSPIAWYNAGIQFVPKGGYLDELPPLS